MMRLPGALPRLPSLAFLAPSPLFGCLDVRLAAPAPEAFPAISPAAVSRTIVFAEVVPGEHQFAGSAALRGCLHSRTVIQRGHHTAPRLKAAMSHRAALERHQARFPKAAAATRIARNATRAGRIPRANRCQVLGCAETQRLERHHHDYDKPLEVLWACAKHHRRGHSVGFIPVAPGIPEHFGNIPRRA